MATLVTDTSPLVAKHATQQVNLPRIALIGVFGPESELRALIRSADGGIARVKLGDRAVGGTVIAISADKMVISTGHSAQVLTLPKA